MTLIFDLENSRFWVVRVYGVPVGFFAGFSSSIPPLGKTAAWAVAVEPYSQTRGWGWVTGYWLEVLAISGGQPRGD